MAAAKTATLTFRIEPDLKEAVHTAAFNAHRYIANMIAVIVRDFCGRVGVEIQQPKESELRVVRKTTKTGARNASS